MSIKVKKKTIKILIAVIIAIAIIVVGVLIIPIVNTNIKIKSAESKLSKIKAKDFENELIEEFKKSPLNINNDTIKTSFGTLDSIDNNASLEMKASIGFSKMNGEKYYRSKYEDLENFVYAYILEYNSNKIENYIVMPLFKIESDSNGNFKEITYISVTPLVHNLTSFNYDILQKVLKNKYNIEMNVSGNLKYNDKFNQSGLKAQYRFSDVDFVINISNTLNQNRITRVKMIEDSNHEIETSYFGSNI